MQNSWGMEYSENGLVSRNNLYIVNDGGAVKTTPDAPGLAICIPSRGTIPVEVFMALKRMAMPINVQAVFLYSRGMMGTSGREIMTAQALQMGASYIYYADDDVLPPANVLYKMMLEISKDESIGLITGVYTNKQIPTQPHIYKHEGEGAYWGFSLSPHDPPEDIWGCGAGCMLVRTAAMKDWKRPYWSENVVPTDDNQMQITGHDLYFCHRIREAGYRTVVDGSIVCDHIDGSTGHAYGLARTSPPVQRHLQDSRNNDWWRNWWGVNPRGEGNVYSKLFDLCEEVLSNLTDGSCVHVPCDANRVAIAQALMNMSNGRFEFAFEPLDDYTEMWLRQHRIPVISLTDADCRLLIEPSEMYSDGFEPSSCDIVIDRTGASVWEYYPDYTEYGAWRTYERIK